MTHSVASVAERSTQNSLPSTSAIVTQTGAVVVATVGHHGRAQALQVRDLLVPGRIGLQVQVPPVLDQLVVRHSDEQQPGPGAVRWQDGPLWVTGLELANTGDDPVAASLTCKCLLAYREVMTDMFKALANSTRRAILDELTDRDGQTLFELCTRLTNRHGVESTRQAISQHLDVLEEAGLVATRREGRHKFHDVDTTLLRSIVERWPHKENPT